MTPLAAPSTNDTTPAPSTSNEAAVEWLKKVTADLRLPYRTRFLASWALVSWKRFCAAAPAEQAAAVSLWDIIDGKGTPSTPEWGNGVVSVFVGANEFSFPTVPRS